MSEQQAQLFFQIKVFTPNNHQNEWFISHIKHLSVLVRTTKSSKFSKNCPSIEKNWFEIFDSYSIVPFDYFSMTVEYSQV